MKAVGMILCLLTCITAFANSKPDWASGTPKEDSSFKYYVGRSSMAPTESAGVREAMQDGQSQAIKENFGAIVKLDTQSYDSLNSVTSVKRTTEGSDAVKLVSFEQQEIFIETLEGSKTNVWVLFRYSKSSIQEEKARLKKMAADKASEKNISFSEVGARGGGENTILEITSRPQGASVFIDNQREGSTPLRIVGQISVGKHLLRLEHPTHDSVEEDLIISIGKPNRIDKLLKRSFGRIKIEKSPKDTYVMVNGRLVNTDELELPVGESVIIEGSNPECSKQVQEIVITKMSAPQVVHINLNYKPSFFTMAVAQANHKIELNGKQITDQGRGQPIECKQGENNLIILSPGFSDHKLEFTCRGGQTIHLSKVELKPYSGPTLFEFSKTSPIILLVRYLYGPSSVKTDITNFNFYGLQLEKPAKDFSAILGLDLIVGQTGYSDATMDTSGYRLSGGIAKFWDKNSNRNLLFQPQLYYLSSKRNIKFDNGDSNVNGNSKVQLGIGIDFVYELAYAKDLSLRIIAGAVSYQNSKGISGNTSYQIGIAVGGVP